MKHCIYYDKSTRLRFVIIKAGVFLLWAVASTLCLAGPASSAATAARASGDRVDAVMQQVRVHVDEGDFEQALALLAPYQERPGIYPTLTSDYLVIMAWSGRPAEAVRQFESLPDSFPRRSYLLRNMAKAYFDLARYARAASLYAEVVAVDPQDHTATEGLVEALVARGDLNAARQALARLKDGSGDPLRADLFEARLLFYQGHYEQSFLLYDRLIDKHPDRADHIAKARDDWIAGLPADRQTQLLHSLEKRAGQPDAPPQVAQYYALCLVLARQYRAAVGLLDAMVDASVDASVDGLVETDGLKMAQVPGDRLYWFAWADFKTGRYRKAQDGFNILLARDADMLRARIGRIYCLAALGDATRASAEIEALETRHAGDPELLYVQAYLFEKQARFWDAVQVYDRMLTLDPGNATAMRLRLRALADMGATSLAARQTARELPLDRQLQSTFRLNAAVDRIRWEEYSSAVEQLSALAASGDEQRYTYDYIVALDRAGRYREAVEAYERLVASGDDPPGWVRLAAADAYAAEEQPLRALEIYDGILADQPALKEARMGKFYTLQTLRRWQAADALLAAMEADTPATVTVKGERRPNPDRFNLTVAKAWYLAYQNRLAESEDMFHLLHAQAPANLDARSGLAHIYLWRGWPRRSLAAFNVIESLDPSYLPSKSGRVMALDRLAEKERSRELAASLLEKWPRNRQVQNTWRTLTVNQMNEWRTELDAQREDDDSYDTRIRTELSSPLGLRTRLFGYLLWRRTWYDGASDADETSAYFRRAGVGIDHIIDADWRIRPEVSFNYDDGKEAGAALRVDYTPTDQWSFGIYGDSFSTDVARRARAAGIEASLIGVDATWRQSEWRQAGIGYTRSFFSDDNERDELSMGYQQNVWVAHDWRMRLYLDLYTTWNSQGDETVYFNPAKAWGLSVTHMTEQTVRDAYRKSFVHRLYLTVGNYRQEGFDSAFTGALRYEQIHAFSDRHALQAGIGCGRNVYDGEGVYDISLDMVYQWRF